MHSETASVSPGAAAEAFEAELGRNAGAVEAARIAGVRLLSAREELVQGPPDAQGNEHWCWSVITDGSRRIIKITKGKHALYGVSGNAAAYLWRWANSNRLFDDDIRIEGVLSDGRFVIS